MEARQWMEEHMEEFTETLCDLVRIPSVSVRTGNPKAPYGEECLRALHACLKVGEGMGLEAFNHENYCGSLYWKGESDTEIGFCGHSDVVPAGEGWTYSPFEPVVKDGLVIGRGAADNKGSILAVLYALRYLKEQSWRPRHSVRFFIGCSEETDMSDLEYYASHYKEPAFSLVPDSTFPLIHGEKGLLEIDAQCSVQSDVLVSFKSGIMSNAVPAHAEAVLRLASSPASALEETGAAVTAGKAEGTWLVTMEGIPAHAAFPAGSDSAQVKLARALLEAGILDEGAREVMEACVSFFGDYYGAGLGVAFSDDISGKLTHVGGMSSMEDGIFRQNINIRYNITADYDTLIARIRDTMEARRFTLTRIHNSSPCYTEPDHPVVQKLTEICNRNLGTDLKPYVMGGGTYARKLKHAVAYGIGIPGRIRRFGTTRGGAHQADEYVELEHLKKGFLIYVEAIQAMDRLVVE